jgi:hypothetical protein
MYSTGGEERHVLKAHFRAHDLINMHLQRLIMPAIIARLISARTDTYSVTRRTELELKSWVT